MKMDLKKELDNIRQKRKKLNNETEKPQKRKIEIIEYDDGTFSLIGYAYSLPLKPNEVEEAFKAWVDNKLES